MFITSSDRVQMHYAINEFVCFLQLISELFLWMPNLCPLIRWWGLAMNIAKIGNKFAECCTLQHKCLLKCLIFLSLFYSTMWWWRWELLAPVQVFEWSWCRSLYFCLFAPFPELFIFFKNRTIRRTGLVSGQTFPQRSGYCSFHTS